ncbi:uncharacterized protein SPPG_04734 [Spizellomyces punctatus DAOM BR117]|uniref:Metallo-beta-lactamase domain-containing protein n=1 Tax=Spizellomyces punctatus (strain DAOM BR117) TaxID=645134 RepID=A0A0L0HFZ3_SPIPD|nr:uncharacterized protein SPPG_04734 [Spizellomyces punctatus DAOM BR117]KND00411.1 hypothetical protein SPPG_04734 [Spizellomyces punctatus DAOM BR117]|eukprot:XP_016608450.1 hypothetical protein SPPG_04734 [Spizellomyces punctatus DAOM BR117]
MTSKAPENRTNGTPPNIKELIFLGTGTSGNVPNIYCLTKDVPDCKVCIAAMDVKPSDGPKINGVISPTPIFNKNKRRTTSAVVRYMHSDGRMRTILIDCGKNFYESALTWFVHYRLRRIDAVLLTHGHADAMLGMDDLRQWTIGGAAFSVQDHIDVYCNEQTMSVVQGAFPYLVDKGKATGGGDVPSLNFRIMETTSEGYKRFMIEELEVIPVEVDHGKYSDGQPFKCLGFRFGDVTYVSDASGLPPHAKELIRGSKVLVMDSLHYGSHASHFSIPEAVEQCASLIKPGGRVFLTGFSHRVDHDTLAEELRQNEDLKKAGVKAEPAYDGLKVVI